MDADYCSFGQDTASGPAVNVPRETYNYDMMPLDAYTPIAATIPEPYLSYITAYADARQPGEHYVAYVTQDSQYISGQWRTATVYNIAVGTDLLYTGNLFSGEANLYKIYTNTNYFSQFATEYDTAFSLSPASALVYSDLPCPYPDISRQSYTRNTYMILVGLVLSVLIGYLLRRKK